MRSLFRVLVAALRSWFRISVSRKARPEAPIRQTDLPAGERQPQPTGEVTATIQLPESFVGEVAPFQADEAGFDAASPVPGDVNAPRAVGRPETAQEVLKEGESDSLGATRTTADEVSNRLQGRSEEHGDDLLSTITPRPIDNPAEAAAETEAADTAQDHTGFEREAESSNEPGGEEREPTAPTPSHNQLPDESLAGAAQDPESGDSPESSAAANEMEQPEDAVEGARPAAGRSGPRDRARRYRAPSLGPPAARPPQATSQRDSGNRGSARGGRALPVELRLFFDRGDYCRLALLPRRASGLPEALTVRTQNGGTVDLIALGDDWYQDIVPSDFSAILREGFVWSDNTTGQEWLLSGREIFVLAPGTSHRGLVSDARLVLEREHAVLCPVGLLPAVEEALRQAGCLRWTRLDENDGAPGGWVVLRDVVPLNAVPWAMDADILNVLRPLLRVEIALEGGICLGYTSWLAEHPPAIRVFGHAGHTAPVLIDGQNATVSEDGRYTVPEWDRIGNHQVWCSGVTKTYSLIRSEPSPEVWAAFSFASSGRQHGQRTALCGPLVRAIADSQQNGEDVALGEVLHVNPSNPVLLGAVPGQVLFAHPRQDVRGAQCIVSSYFAPVWALPSEAMLCDKKMNCVRLVGDPLAPGQRPDHSPAPAHHSSIQQWCRLIRDAGRKGLTVEPSLPATVDLWSRYRDYARRWERRSR